MQTYTYSELSRNAKGNVFTKYHEDQAVVEQVSEMMDDTSAYHNNLQPSDVFEALAWRYNEHGERIA